MIELERQADAVERLLKGRGLDGYEIMVSASRDLAIEAKEGKVDAFRCAEPSGVAVRLMIGSGLGYSFSTTTEPEALSRMVEGAVVAAKTQTPDEGHVLPLPCAAYPEVEGMFDADLPTVDEDLKVARALELERLVLASDPRVKRVRKCSYGESVYATVVRNSHGLACGYRGSYVTCSVSALAEADGDAQSGWDFGFSHGFDGIDIEAVAAGAGMKATRLLGAQAIPTMRCRVVLENHVASDFLEILAPSFLGESVLKRKSLLTGRMGETLFSKLLNIRDNGVLPGGIGSAPCDGEGVPQRDTLLVDNGRLDAFLYDSYWGKKAGMPSTGNAVRGGLKTAPRLGTHNFFIAPGAAGLSELLSGVERGVLVTSVMGMHTANPISGDFSVGASGLYIEGGEIVHPVKGIAIAGNLLDLFGGVDLVGNDLRFFGSVGAPSLRVGELDVSGK